MFYYFVFLYHSDGVHVSYKLKNRGSSRFAPSTPAYGCNVPTGLLCNKNLISYIKLTLVTQVRKEEKTETF